MTSDDIIAYYIDRMENASSLVELEAVGSEIKEVRDLLSHYFISNRQRISDKDRPMPEIKEKI